MIIEKIILNDLDDQILSHHKIIDCIVDQNSTNVVFVVGSWVSSDFENNTPTLKTNLTVHYDQWSFEYYNLGIQTVMGHPDWTGVGPEKPNLSYIWNPTTLNWIPPADVPLDTLKFEKWQEIKSMRNSIEFNSFIWNDYIFDSSQMSIIRIGSQAQSAIISKMTSSVFSIIWTLRNNKTIVLSGDDMISVSKALTNHISFCHTRSKELRNQLDLAKSSLQISQVVW